VTLLNKIIQIYHEVILVFPLVTFINPKAPQNKNIYDSDFLIMTLWGTHLNL